MRVVSRKQFGDLAGVTRSRVTQLCKKELAPALSGKRIDIDHDSAREYLKKRGVDLTSMDQFGQDQPLDYSLSQNQETEELSQYPEKILQMTLQEVVRIWGTKQQFLDWLKAVKLIAETQDKNHKIQRERGELIERDFVRTHLFSLIDAAFRRLLGDSSKTIARKLYGMAKAGEPIEEAEKKVKELISSQIKPMKAEAIRKVKNIDVEHE